MKFRLFHINGVFRIPSEVAENLRGLLIDSATCKDAEINISIFEYDEKVLKKRAKRPKKRRV